MENMKLLSIKLRPWLFRTFYPYSVVLVDLDTNIFYNDVADEMGVCKNFKPTYRIDNVAN